MNMDYQFLLNGIFICGVNSVNTVIKNEGIDVVLDLRAESTEHNQDHHVEKLQVPLIDGVANQTDLLQRAITFTVDNYKKGNKVVLH
jgi:protein-tyrosine phosphatase